jgi:hypothetical protein
MKKTFSVVWWLVEIAGIVRSALATFAVVNAITNGDFIYSVFTVLTVEGLFIASLFLMRVESVAPISALLALAFAGVMQLYELKLLDGSISVAEKDILRYAVAFSPIVILLLGYLRHLTGENESGDSSPFDSIKEKISDAMTPGKKRGRPSGLK